MRLNKYYEKGKFINQESSYNNYLGKITETHNRRQNYFDCKKREYILKAYIADLYKLRDLNGNINGELSINTNLVELVYDIISFFSDFGMPLSIMEDDDNGEHLVSIQKFIEEVGKIFLFREQVKKFEEPFELLEVSGAKFGVKKENDGCKTLYTFFTNPFEYTKFLILLNIMKKEEKIKICKHCQSMFISKRSHSFYCSELCKMQAFRLKNKIKEE